MGGPAPRISLNFKLKPENEDSKPPIIKKEEIEVTFKEEEKPVIDLKLGSSDDSKNGSVLAKRSRSSSVSGDVVDTPSPQRRRLVLDAVVVTRRHAPPQNDRTRENSVPDVKVKADIKVKVKKYRQDTHFSLSIVHERLKDVKDFIVNLKPGEEDFIVTRDFTSRVYGGSSQATVPEIAEEKVKKHGFDDFLYPSQEYNPHAPGKAGAKGMMFGVGPYAREWPGIHRVIVGIAPKQWMYVGQYKLISAPSMSAEEWSQTNIKVRKAWAGKIAKLWGWDVRARITLRKRLGREPAEAEIDEINEKDQPFLDVTIEEVMEAFTKGEEAIWNFECVGFDYDFYRQMIEKYRAYQANPPPRNPRKKKDSQPKKPGVRNAKVKNVRVDRWEEASDGENEEGFELVYHPKGTASRPRK